LLVKRSGGKHREGEKGVSEVGMMGVSIGTNERRLAPREEWGLIMPLGQGGEPIKGRS